MRSGFPALYPILDAAMFPSARSERDRWLRSTVEELGQAGVTLMQLRVKDAPDAEVLRDAVAVREAARGAMTLVLNDRVALAEQAGFAGVHLGQEDMDVSQARALLGPDAIIGLSTHNTAQLRAGDASSANYLAIGPVFATVSKQNLDPVVGLEGVRAAREITNKPLVAIGGIALECAPAVWAAGADSLAVIGALFQPGGSPGAIARDFLGHFHYNSM